MIDSNEKRFSEALFATFEIYDKQTTDTTIKIWWACLKQYEINQVCQALTSHIKCPNNGTFAPKPADIIKQIDGTREDKQLHIETMAVMAFQHAVAGISKFGSYNAPNFRDKVTAKVISVMGGWKAFCQTEESKMVWKQKEFVGLYGDYHDKPLEALACTLKGIADKPELLEMNPVLKKLTNQQDK